MVFLIGTVLVGSHLMFLMLVAKVCSAYLPMGGLTVFLILAVLSGLAMLRIQTLLEKYFIARHIKKRPNSGWKVVAKQSQPREKLKSRKKRLGNAGKAVLSAGVPNARSSEA